MKRSLLYILLLLAMPLASFAQYYSLGTEPTTVLWRQIRTSHFQVIYPKGYDSVAQEFTKKLECVYESCSKSLKHEPRKISVILHNRTNVSNGSVIWCPKQMDVYGVTSQDQHSQEWFENLAIHEFRHVVQIDKVNQGLTHILSFLLGEQAVGIVSGLYLPRWMLEGDAVCTETALGNGGRGRTALFSQSLRAQLYDKGAYSYSKAYFGSFKDHVPSYYSMGFYFLANARRQFGVGLEADIIDHAAKNPFRARPVNAAIHAKTGKSRNELYTQIFEEQANEWKLKHDREIPTRYDTIAATSSVYTNYINGMQIGDNVFFCERKGLDRIPQLVRIANGKERVVANVGFKPADDRIHTNGRTIVWQESHNSIRWEQKQNSFIYIYDIEHDQLRKIRTKRHVFAPAVSPSDNRIAATEIDENGAYFITIYDRHTKHILKRIASPDNDFISNISWNEAGSRLVFVGLNQRGKRIVEYNLVTESFSEILPYSTDDYTQPVYWKEFILYSSSYSGIDNIYAYNPATRQTWRVTVGEFGCRFPSVSDSSLVYSNYTSNGYNLARISLNPKFWHPLSAVRQERYNLAEMLKYQEGGAVDFSQMPDTTYPSKHYSKLLHAINVFGWMPFCSTYNGTELESLENGVQLLSQNHLGSTVSSVGYKWNTQEDYRAAFAKVTYSGLFPVFDVDFEHGKTRIASQDREGKDATATYNVNSVYGRMYLPLNFSSKSYRRYVIPAMQCGWQHYQKQDVTPRTADDLFRPKVSSHYMAYTLQLTNIRTTSTQELAPRFGQQLFAGYEHSPLSTTELFDDYAFATARIYLPGLARSHSIAFYGGYEWNKTVSDMNFSRQIAMPRGYLEPIATQKEMAAASANYSFPLCYPDWEAGCVMYLKRIRCTVFADYAQTCRQPATRRYFSCGAEFMADVHILGFVAPFNIGVRASLVPTDKVIVPEFLFSVDFGEL